MSGRLIALALPGGDRFVHELTDAWESGDAVLPVDLRLPDRARARLLAALAPHALVDDKGHHQLDGGVPCEPGDALVVATSGTTGTPKGVVLSHEAVAASAHATSRRLEVDPTGDRWLACLPLSHVGGLAVVTRALLTGTGLEVHPGFEAASVMDAAQRGATLASVVPTALARIDPAAFRVLLVGGSAVPVDRPANTLATYGMTETGSGVVYDGLPLDGVEMRIVDAFDDGTGEIQLRCPMLLRAYRDGTDPRTDDGWYPTGDLGSIDDDGVISVRGRRGDLIITGGENVWPTPVEAILEHHPALAEVAVVGRPDAEWGAAVTAVAVIEPGVDAPSLDELRELVRAELPAFCAPRRLEIVDVLARTALGKIRRDAL